MVEAKDFFNHANLQQIISFVLQGKENEDKQSEDEKFTFRKK